MDQKECNGDNHAYPDLSCEKNNEPPPLPSNADRDDRLSSSSIYHTIPSLGTSLSSLKDGTGKDFASQDSSHVVLTDPLSTPASTDSGRGSLNTGNSPDRYSSPGNSDSDCDENIEHYDDVGEAPEEATRLLTDTEADAETNDVEVVAHEPPKDQEGSWNQLLRSSDGNSKAREAVLTLGNLPSLDISSPLSYKNWLSRLSHRRRFEILIAVGLFLWIAFFIALAVAMNGQSSKSDKLFNPGAGSYRPDLPKPFEKTLPTTIANHTTTIADPTTPHSQPTLDKYPAEERRLVNTPTIDVTSKATTSSTSSVPSKATTSSTSSVPSKATTSSTSAVPSKATTSSTSAVPSKATDRHVILTTESPASSSNLTAAVATTSNSVDDTSSDTARTVPTKSPDLPPYSSAFTSPTTAKQAGITKPAGSVTATYNSAQAESLKYDEAEKSLLYNQLNRINLTQILQGKEANYMVGVGRADITGPAADANMMGYANPNQVVGGIHMRQYSRAFVIGQGHSRLLFINMDACMGSTLVKLEVLKQMQKRYGDLYSAENVCISGTHTHSAPAGFLQDVLFQITSLGYIPETLNAMVNGIVESVRIAHDNYAPGFIVMKKGELLESNINRSPSAYANNPKSEKDRYKYNVDKEMVLIKFLDAEHKGIGMINWFPVHCTSMNNTNTLISGDNKGYAELLFEEAMDPGSLAGQSKFVAAFAQSNEGDVSPNTRGPHCTDTGLPCDNVHSTCDGKVQNCVASGPGKDMFESTKIIGNNQFVKAMELYDNADILITGPVQFVHQYIDMTKQTIAINSTYTANTCKPAMGFSFAAGTTDGPGAFDFKQSDKTGNVFWRTVRNFLHSPSKPQADCHFPKPILVDTGEMTVPYPWQPEVVDTQLFRIGQLLISAVPGEFTTMSGRRVYNAVLEEFSKRFPDVKFESLIAGLSNTYSDYIATYEEYQEQRYEGASTIYGPHTLTAYVQQYRKMASAMAEKKPLDGGAEAHDIKDSLLSFLPGVVFDTSPISYSFGDVLTEAEDQYKIGDVVSVRFVAGNPRNSPTANMTFLTVEREVEKDVWRTLYNDGSWYTRYIWKRTSVLGKLSSESEVTITWEIPPGVPSGRYRINHYGHYKYFWNHRIYEYRGISKSFLVTGDER